MLLKPLIGITAGDHNGIGPEIALKAAVSSQVQKICIPVLIGITDQFLYYSHSISKKKFFCEVETPERTTSSLKLQIINCDWYRIPVIEPGKISRHAGEFAGIAIETAVKLWKNGAIDALVTAPVSKEAMKKAGYEYPGQTEMVAKLTEQKHFMMMLKAKEFRVGLATIHVPLKDVSEMISRKLIVEKLSMLHHALQQDFGIAKPRIAVLGLNPHAGENGHIGKEEQKHIQPAIRYVQNKGMQIEGCFPADGFFGMHSYKNYSAVLAMYHDQGLIPLKMQGFETGVNVTLGLPIVRTSPDHGTAFDIAGKNIANPSSMITAIASAVEIVKNRKKYNG